MRNLNLILDVGSCAALLMLLDLQYESVCLGDSSLLTDCTVCFFWESGHIMKARQSSKCLSESWLGWINPTWKLFMNQVCVDLCTCLRNVHMPVKLEFIIFPLMWNFDGTLLCHIWQLGQFQFSFTPWSHCIAYTNQVWKSSQIKSGLFREHIYKHQCWPKCCTSKRYKQNRKHTHIETS